MKGALRMAGDCGHLPCTRHFKEPWGNRESWKIWEPGANFPPQNDKSEIPRGGAGVEDIMSIKYTLATELDILRYSLNILRNPKKRVFIVWLHFSSFFKRWIAMAVFSEVSSGSITPGTFYKIRLLTYPPCSQIICPNRTQAPVMMPEIQSLLKLYLLND